ncbi:hypothetical protein EX30DRAFT_339284 [Ascodesmis nigricans]|uniref:Tim44-like domain-containing protein n=1 Tax=Ascodesmis nigricans TaxID=341454 RepID=A0A4S2N1Z5_9PEZI|nr:hypothetical protein EX30DRAFT_339284 [Ascodesmis nigricans]
MVQFLATARLGARTTVFRPLSVAKPVGRLDFSTTSAFLKAGGHKGRNGLSMMAPKMEATQSHRIAAKEEGNLLDDFGLMPETFVMPTGKNRPSIFKQPKENLDFRWTRYKRGFRNFREWLLYLWNVKGQWKMIWEPKKLVANLHQDMYEAYARGDGRALTKVCGAGLMNNFTSKLIRRPKGVKMEWRLHKYLSPIKMVSNRAHFYLDMGFNRRQAVFRIHSTQSLTKYDAKGNVVPGTGEPKELVEYVVLEQMALKGRPRSHWYVWGTTEETTELPKA